MSEPVQTSHDHLDVGPSALRALMVWVICITPVVVGLTMIGVGLTDAAKLKEFADAVSPDGNAEQFTEVRFEEMGDRLIRTGAGWLVMAMVVTVLMCRYACHLWAAMTDAVDLIKQNTARLRRLEPMDRGHWYVLMGLTVVGAAGVIRCCAQPMRVDESGTFLSYASQPWFFALTVWNEPNNHILHSFLVHLSCAVFGESEWAIRLPAMLAGILLIPVTYAAMRIQFNRSVGLLTAAMLATSTYALDFAANARGYTIIMLMFMGLLWLMPKLLSRRPKAWIAFVLLGAVGLYTVPIMVFPLAIVGLWLMISAVLKAPPEGRRLFFLKFVFGFASIGLLTLALYSPALVVSNIQTEMQEATTFAAHESRWDIVVHSLAPRFDKWWEFWAYDYPLVVSVALLLGFGVSAFLSGRMSAHGSRLFWASALGFLGVVIVMKRLPPDWSVPFLWPLFLALAGAGLMALVKLIRLTNQKRLDQIVIVLVLLMGLGQIGRLVFYGISADVPWQSGYADVIAAAEAVEQPVRDGAMIMGHGITTSPLRYYLYRRGIRHVDAILGHRKDRPDVVYVIHIHQNQFQEGRYEADAKTLVDAGYEATGEMIRLDQSDMVRFVRVADGDDVRSDDVVDGPTSLE